MTVDRGVISIEIKLILFLPKEFNFYTLLEKH